MAAPAMSSGVHQRPSGMSRLVTISRYSGVVPCSASGVSTAPGQTVLTSLAGFRVRQQRMHDLFFVQLYRWFPSILKAMLIIRPETLIRWHRAGFRGYWRWKSRSLGGRPPISTELRASSGE